MHTYQLGLYNIYLSRAVTALAALCTLCVFLYAIFLLMAVKHTAARTEAQREADTMSAHVGDMEMHYLEAQKALTPELAQTLGFTQPSAVFAVYTSALQEQLTVNANR